MDKNDKIYIAGHKGLVGSALVRQLQRRGYHNLLCASHADVDLTQQLAVDTFFEREKPDYVFLSAAKVGGINANNSYPADFGRINLQIECNIIHAAYRFAVKKLLFLGSSCIYPKLAEQPMKESELLSGYLEPTNIAYAIAKIAGIVLCQSYNKQYNTNFISVMPTNLYGLRDNYHPEDSHVLPALIRKFHEAKVLNQESVVVWGSGTPKREFLYSDDCADACIFCMNKYNSSDIINIGTSEEIRISDLALLIKNIIGFKGTITFDASKPDGSLRKLLDCSKINSLGWQHTTNLAEGIPRAYEDFLQFHTSTW